MNRTITRTLVVFILMLGISFSGYSQKKKSSSKGNQAFSRNDLTLGLKLGDPTGVTLKQYMDKKALEFVFGFPIWGGAHYADRYYDRKYDYDYRGHGYYTGRYGYNYFGMALQVHYLWRFPIGDIDGFTWHIGFGGQVRYNTFVVPVRQYYDNFGNYYYAEDRVHTIDIGPDVVGGIEYALKQAPITFFADANVFIAFLRYPNAYGQGGIGGRFSFGK
ncbi:hypothetical protein [Sporocytophaga myxococcoides]|uniref:hypothetical protein n=1 Tax=Sporocytophaga myxococcoides TaxID=153721 RepID=UPI00040F1C32|nr:hypothetical protein [Sporocytophaga myxococcoides]